MTYNYRYLARIIIEAEAPIVIKSGEKNFLTDGVVLRDVNGLPYIPGTSIAGVVRHAWIDAGKDYKDIFGFQEKNGGEGSKITFSEARILDSFGHVVDGLQTEINDSLLMEYKQLPIRQHVRITEKGVAANTGKYDEEIVYKGTRFCFEMEMIGQKEDEVNFDKLLDILQGEAFRFGSGTRSGFGKIKVVSFWKRSLDLTRQLDCYLLKSSNLEDSKNWYKEEFCKGTVIENDNWVKYELTLEPEDFFLFGSGFGDEEADMTPVKETIVTGWEIGKAELKEVYYLVPATSIKGAIAHRVAFHYNRKKKRFADDKTMTVNDRNQYLGKNNKAVKLLFGSEGDEKGKGKLRGNVILSDLFINNVSEKLLNHVAIDRFTGGAIKGALFSEKTLYGGGNELKIKILVKMKDMDDDVVIAFEQTLDDICKGMLPLGGGINRGHGIFTGTIKKNGGELCVKR